MLTTLLAMASIQGAGIVGFNKINCQFLTGTQYKGRATLTFTGYSLFETEVWKSVTFRGENNSNNAFGRWVKIKGVKRSDTDRTVKVVIHETIEIVANTKSPDLSWFSSDSVYPTFGIKTAIFGYQKVLDRNVSYSFTIPSGQTEAQELCSTQSLTTAIGGHPDTSGYSTITSEIKSWNVTTP